jgi:hypothetical protein
MTFDRQIIEAQIALGRIPPEDMTALAADALEAGLDGPAIRRMAALEKPSGWETDQVLARFMAEAGLRPIANNEAAIRLGRDLARRIVRENLDPLEHLGEFYSLYWQPDYPKELCDLGLLDDERCVFADLGHSEAEFLEYAWTTIRAFAAGGEEGER